ncbi:MAG: hypothetical protein HXN00_00060 [Porphyromonadaceae bacterium]|nr:hypothetical protein [Porphyromonadaceae bacterium]FAA03807.1 MAG TPA: hypothetical protein [Siphovirus LN-2020-2]
MPGVTPLLHGKVRGESSPFSTVYISPTDGVTDASITLGANPEFELDVPFYEGSKALVRVVRKDGSSEQKMIDLKESMPEKVVWFNNRAAAGYGTFDTGWIKCPDDHAYVYRIMAGVVYVKRNSDWQTQDLNGTRDVKVVDLPKEIQVRSRATFVLPKGDYTDDGSIIEIWPGDATTPPRVRAQLKSNGARIIPVLFAPIENSNG